jgi:hypothetical protein
VQRRSPTCGHRLWRLVLVGWRASVAEWGAPPSSEMSTLGGEVLWGSAPLDPSLQRRASLRLSEVGLYFVEFGSIYNNFYLGHG